MDSPTGNKNYIIDTLEICIYHCAASSKSQNKHSYFVNKTSETIWKTHGNMNNSLSHDSIAAEILLFSDGNPEDPKTWSNVPYCMLRELRSAGYSVVPCDLKVGPLKTISLIIGKIFQHAVVPLLSLFYPDHSYSYSRTWLYGFIASRHIKEYHRKHTNARLSIFTSFSYYDPNAIDGSYQLCDWSYEYHIANHCKRRPYWFEKLFIRRENYAMAHSSGIAVLFEESKQFISLKNPGLRLVHLNINVVNNLCKTDIPSVDDLVLKKYQSSRILFIGGKRYIDAARLLIQAFAKLRQNNSSLKLDLIGLTQDDFPDESLDGITCHGYLNKGIDTEEDKYYNLLMSAYTVVMPSHGWGAYSSLIEAMFFYSPIILAPFKVFYNEFGSNPSFAKYCDTNIESIEHCIDDVLSLEYDKYSKMAYSAHAAVANYTWENYIKQLFKHWNIQKK